MRKLPNRCSPGDAFRLSGADRLGVLIPAYQRPTTVLARDIVAILWQACTQACRSNAASLVSHVSPHFWDTLERERREPQGRTGTAASCGSESHDRCLHAGSRSTEARGAEQFGQTCQVGRGFGSQARLNGSNWIMKKSGDSVEAFYFVGVPINDFFEHLSATIAEATPVYELCASVLGSTTAQDMECGRTQHSW
jgi:hypothetical protein